VVSVHTGSLRAYPGHTHSNPRQRIDSAATRSRSDLPPDIEGLRAIAVVLVILGGIAVFALMYGNTLGQWIALFGVEVQSPILKSALPSGSYSGLHQG